MAVRLPISLVLAALLAGASLPAAPPSTGKAKTPSHGAASDADAAKRQAFLGTLGTIPPRPPVRITVLESVRLDGGWRRKIEYLAEPADPRFHTPVDMIRAYLFVPDHAEGRKLPAVLAIHQDGPQSHIGKSEPAGLAGADDQHYGFELFRRGYVVLCPDRFGHAERRSRSRR
jgi:hypothetical protein